MVLRLWRVRHGCLRHPCGAEGAAFGAEGATIGACGTEPHGGSAAPHAPAGHADRAGRFHAGTMQSSRVDCHSVVCDGLRTARWSSRRKVYIGVELELTTTAPCQCQGAAMAEASTRMTEQWQNHDRTMAELCGNRGRTLWCPAPSARAEAGQNMGQSHCRAWQQLAAARGRLHPW
eukprot:gene16253-biopygen5250